MKKTVYITSVYCIFINCQGLLHWYWGGGIINYYFETNQQQNIFFFSYSKLVKQMKNKRSISNIFFKK